jgi:hypothetical protein
LRFFWVNLLQIFQTKIVVEMHTIVSVLLLLGFAAIAVSAAPQEEPTRFDIYFVLRSYDSKMWHCNDGVDRYIPDDAPSPKDKAAFMAYVKNMDVPASEKPAFRYLKDGSKEPDVLDDGNCWITLVNPETKERHSYLVASDGYHDAPANGYVEAVEAVSGKNYARKLDFQTEPLTWSEVRAIGARVGRNKRIDSMVNGYPYKGPDFAIDFVFDLVNPTIRSKLQESANSWPVSMQLLDNYYYEKHGNSAFERHGIDRGIVPERADLSTMTVDGDIDLTPNREPEEMDVYFVLRSYDSSMWHCRDRKDRKIPANVPSYTEEREEFEAYINRMPENERPMMRTLKNGKQEPDVLDDGNCWITVVHPRTKERYAYLVSTDGYHDVRGGTYIPSVEDVSGKNYVKKLSYKTRPFTFPELKRIGSEVNNGRRVDQPIDGEQGYLYKGSDFCIDFLMAIVDPEIASKLQEFGNSWPVSMQLLDNYYFNKHGMSAFERHGIDRGIVPARAHLSTMSVDSLDVNPVKA